MIVCARNGCDNKFEPHTHNMKYCGPTCCKIATNSRVMENYYKERARLAGKIRYCSKCKVTRLSRYNDSQICGPCKEASTTAANAAVAAMLSNVQWQA